MQSGNTSAPKSEHYSSMVGVGLLADILPDLPLPTYHPTPLEATVLGNGELKSENRRVLSHTDPQLCSQISKTLQSVDINFLKLKVAPPKQEYRPDITSPVLIKALLKNGFPQPRIKLKKIDLNQYHQESVHTSSPHHSSTADVTVPSTLSPQNIHVSCSSLFTPPQASKSIKKRQTPHSFSEEQKISSTSSSDKMRRSSTPRSSDKQPVKRKGTRTNSLVVSIKKDLLSTSSLPQRRSKRRLSSSSSEADSIKGKPLRLPVSISRTKLPPTPSSHKQHPSQHHLGNTVDNGNMVTNGKYPWTPVDGYSNENDKGFSIAPGLHDQAVPDFERKKKKKKHRQQFHKDNTQLVHIERYNHFIEAVFEQLDQCDPDELLSRHIVTQLLSETARLKQLMALHQVSTDILVRLISVMDHHVLDTASLLISNIPDDIELKVWREKARERILRSLDAGLVILHITTAPNMPKNVHLEESIDQLISHTKYHLENNIYPEFDPVYRAEAKETGVLPRQKRRYASTANKDIITVYHRMVEVMDTLSLLLETQALTDITVLKLSSLGIFPFFVENVSTLQLSSLKLVRTIFSLYEKHRDLILEDIFASLARLPTTKRNLRNFRLSNGQSIQMVTALILQLVQCMVIITNEDTNGVSMETKETGSKKDKSQVAPDVAVISSYELALRTGSNFLSSFLRKCCSGKDDDDFRPLFDNFVQDLLATLSLPEWPASEVLLTLLGVLLVQAFSNRSNEQQLRLTSLEHLGVIAARLRRDAVSSVQEDHDQLIDILAEILQRKFDSTSPLPSPTGLKRMDAFSENARHLQKTLIAFLSRRSEADPSCAYARYFHLGQWLRDNQLEIERLFQQSSDSHNNTDTTLDDGEDRMVASPSVQLLHQAELTKEFIMNLMKPMPPSVIDPLASVLDDKRAILVTRYLASSRALNKSFDMYLQKLLRVLNESAVHVRTRAMKALSTIVAADPSILSRTELQRAVHYRFSDSSTLMREAAVDLVGRFVLIQPELTATYYQMLLERILDTGVSVRKRVIKILRDICVNQPDFDKVTDICIKMIRRINDEEGIKQLVTSVFQQLWFTKPITDQRQQIMRRVTHITEVVAASINEQECFEQLLEQLLKGVDESTGIQSVLSVCQLMVDCLVERVLSLDETSDQQINSRQLVNCITTLYIFSKIRASFLLHHAKTLHPYLSSKCTTQEDTLIIHYIARILEVVVPLMERPTESFLASLEEDLVKLIMKQGAMIVQSCVGCLAEVVDKVTKNYKLVKECYQKFFMYLEKVKLLYTQDPKSPQLATVKPSVLRSTFTVGLFCKHFNMDNIMIELQGDSMSKRVQNLLVFFCDREDEEVRIKALIGLGFLCVKYPELMLDNEVKDLYLSSLAKEASLKMKCQVVKNLQTHLIELESTLKQADATRNKGEGGEENLMELGDHHSSVSSNVAQVYLPRVLETYYTNELQVRLSTVQTVLLILRQGLVHPGQCVPHLIAMSTDTEQNVRIKADLQLSEYSSRYGGFIQTHLVSGLKRAYQFQQLIADSSPRGCTEHGPNVSSASLLSHLYMLLRSSRPQRRAFLKAVLKPFEDYDQTSLGMLLFLADNISSFPYSVVEEPLFVIHHIDMTLSVTGASILQSFREALGKTGTAAADDEEDDVEKLSQESMVYNLNQLNDCCRSCLGCVLLLVLKQHLKHCYSLSDNKCQEYTPANSSKMWEKAVSRRHGNMYSPREVIEEVEREAIGKRKNNSKEDCIKLYMHFKRLMNRLDPFEGEEEEEESDMTVFEQQQQPKAPSTLIPVIEKISTEQLQEIHVPPVTSIPSPKRKRSRSRASSTSSTSSVNSRGKKRRKSSSGDGEGKPVKRRRYNVMSDSDSENDPDYNVH